MEQRPALFDTRMGLKQNPVPQNKKVVQFPEGMRVLAVDSNAVSLKVLVALLIKCKYEVAATTDANEALKLLRETPNCFNLVITNVVRLDMDGFKILEIIGLEMELPVVMVSANDDRENVMRGIKHGARDYLLKPVRLTEIKNIWQHVVRKKLQNPEKSGVTEGNVNEKSTESKRLREKIKEEEQESNPQSDLESSPPKKPRLKWSEELHLKFVESVQHLGGVHEAYPKNILEHMNIQGLTRENVSSHLQKYRKSLKDLDKQINTGVVDPGRTANGNVFTTKSHQLSTLNLMNHRTSIPRWMRNQPLVPQSKGSGIPFQYPSFSAQVKEASSSMPFYLNPSVPYFQNPYPQVFGVGDPQMPSYFQNSPAFVPIQSGLPGQLDIHSTNFGAIGNANFGGPYMMNLINDIHPNILDMTQNAGKQNEEDFTEKTETEHCRQLPQNVQSLNVPDLMENNRTYVLQNLTERSQTENAMHLAANHSADDDEFDAMVKQFNDDEVPVP